MDGYVRIQTSSHFQINRVVGKRTAKNGNLTDIHESHTHDCDREKKNQRQNRLSHRNRNTVSLAVTASHQQL